jgi:hypothetical protein
MIDLVNPKPILPEYTQMKFRGKCGETATKLIKEEKTRTSDFSDSVALFFLNMTPEKVL